MRPFIVAVLGLTSLGAAAAPYPLARVELGNCGTVIDEGPLSASASNAGVITSGACAQAGPAASGGARFSDGYIFLSMDSDHPGRGVDGIATLDDLLTFHVVGGGSSVVTVTMSGSWGGTFNDAANASFQVEFSLGLGPTLYQGKGYSNLAYDDGSATSDAFTGTEISTGTILGGYSFTTNWTVFDGQSYEFLAGLKAQAGNGATSYIDDPLIIALPAGVTYSSAAGRTYAPVPAPSALLLFATTLVAAAARRRRPLPESRPSAG